MGKAEQNKQKKRDALLNAAFNLFTTKGIHNTSISEIAEKAGVAKGTYYLYFKDKYDINNKLMMYKAGKLVDNAMEKVNRENLPTFKERLVFFVNDIIDSLTDNKVLLMFITKNLWLGFYRQAVGNIEINNDPQIHAAYQILLDDVGDTVSNPELMLYLIIELVGSSIYSSILYDQPVPISELKPYLYDTITRIVDQFTNHPDDL